MRLCFFVPDRNPGSLQVQLGLYMVLLEEVEAMLSATMPEVSMLLACLSSTW